MAQNLEMDKFKIILQKPDAIRTFQSMYDRCRLLSRTQKSRVPDGELMAVCAYLTGREYAGSPATKDACMRLGCMNNKTFDRVEDIVRTLLKPNSASNNLSISSLSAKYEFTSEELQAIQGVENALKFKISKRELEDERVVCAIMAIICTELGYQTRGMLQVEMAEHDIDKKDLDTMIERVEMAHGEEIKFIVTTYNNAGRTSRQRLPDATKSRHALKPLKPKQQGKSTPLKRIASQELFVKPRANKRPKVETRSSRSIPSTPSSIRSDSPVPQTQATHTSNSRANSTLDSTPEAFQKLTLSDDQAEWEEESLPIELDEELDWEPLAKLRQRVIEKEMKEIHSTKHRTNRPVFLDRSFWEH
ncbi:hypothetical protein CPB86DRAFT_703465 [Serendipita vermifera]|nr:hypothetical protein CPB86DRAFT_703465 [Serendipita vermifera]